MNARVCLRVGAAACLCAFAAAAFAHAFLEHAMPPVGSTVASAPVQVSLKFTQRLEPAFSRVQVLDASGKRVDRNDARVPDDQPTMLVASLGTLEPGRYVVKWRVLSVDTHVTEGDYTFTVGL